MAKLSLGRRLSLAFAGSISLGLLFYWLGEIIIVAVAGMPPTTPMIGMAVGVGTGVSIALAADLEAATK